MPPDVQFRHAGPRELVYAHRELKQGHAYFVASQANRPIRVDASFRVGGFEAEFWRPDTGVAEPAPYSRDGDRTRVPLELDPYGSVFIVFRHASDVATRQMAPEPLQEIARFDAGWRVDFQKGRGAPDSIVLNTLESLTSHGDPGVRYFSGVATYTREIEVERSAIESAGRIWLDLGGIRDLAQVFVNGREAGIVWKRPFCLDIRPHLKPGRNELEVRVANTWRNRVVGDKVMASENPVSRHNPVEGGLFQMIGTAITKDTPLLDSGLLGPVVLSVQGRQGPMTNQK